MAKETYIPLASVLGAPRPVPELLKAEAVLLEQYFSDEQLFDYILIGEDSSAPRIQQALEQSPELRARVRELKQRLWLEPTDALDRLLEQSERIVMPQPSEKVCAVSSQESKPRGKSLRRMARVVCWCNNIGYGEIALPARSGEGEAPAGSFAAQEAPGNLPPQVP